MNALAGKKFSRPVGEWKQACRIGVQGVSRKWVRHVGRELARAPKRACKQAAYLGKTGLNRYFRDTP